MKDNYAPNVSSPIPDPAMIGSPLKKARPSNSGLETELRRSTAENLVKGLGFGFSDPEIKTETGPELVNPFGPPIQASVKTESSDSHPVKTEDKVIKEDDEL